MDWIFAFKSDHLQQYRYASENQTVEILIGANRVTLPKPGEGAFFWMNKDSSPFAGDGRAIFGRGVVRDISPRRMNPGKVERYLPNDSPIAIQKLRGKQNEPHATIRILRVLSESDLITREWLVHNEPNLLSAIENAHRHNSRTLAEPHARRLDELINLPAWQRPGGNYPEHDSDLLEGEPQRVETHRSEFVRNPEVRDNALVRAAGICEMPGCGWHGFKTNQGEAFLEVHHVWPLAQGGPDTLDNAIALCPNCHRAMHHAADRLSRENQLRKNYSWLRPRRDR